MRSSEHSFVYGQRGIVVFRTFNEGRELAAKKPGGKPTAEQWTIDPGDGIPRGFAFVWRRFEVGGQPPFLAAVMCTIPASELVRRVLNNPDDPDPRMPAILEDQDWSTWLGEIDATPTRTKGTLRTMEGVGWQAFAKPKGPKAPRAPVPPEPKADDQPGFL